MKKLIFLLVLCSFSAGAAEVERVTRGDLAIEGIPEIPPELHAAHAPLPVLARRLLRGLDARRAHHDQHALRQHEPAARRGQAAGRAPPDHLLRRADLRRRLVADRRAQGRRLHPRHGRQRELPARVPRSRGRGPGAAHRRARPRGHGRVVAGRHEVRVPVDGADRRRDRRLHRRSARSHGARSWSSRRPRWAGTRWTGPRTGSRCC